jgi:hypothetical protein
MSLLALQDRRPLMVGSEPIWRKRRAGWTKVRRPLMVGSERRRRARAGARSPSPHGRVGTIAFAPDIPPTGVVRRPLMVGSEPIWRKRRAGWTKVRRPLMVGSEPEILGAGEKGDKQSPSPHGRVGTTLKTEVMTDES